MQLQEKRVGQRVRSGFRRAQRDGLSGAEDINIAPASRIRRPDAEVDNVCTVRKFNPSAVLFSIS